MTGTGSLRSSSFRLLCKRTTASSRLTSLRLPSRPIPPSPSLSLSHPLSLFLFFARSSANPPAHLLLDPRTRCAPSRSLLSRSFVRSTDRPTDRFSLPSSSSTLVVSLLSHESVATRAKRPTASSFLAASLRGAAPMRFSFSRSHHSAAFARPARTGRLFLSSSPREAEVTPRIRFFILPPPPLSPLLAAVRLSFSSFSRIS